MIAHKFPAQLGETRSLLLQTCGTLALLDPIIRCSALVVNLCLVKPDSNQSFQFLQWQLDYRIPALSSTVVTLHASVPMVKDNPGYHTSTTYEQWPLETYFRLYFYEMVL